MFRLAARSARHNWRRFVLTSVAVIVGVAFAVGSFVLTDSLKASIDRLLSDATARTDLVVRAASSEPTGGGRPAGFGGRGLGPRSGVDRSLIDTVSQVPGVVAVDGSVAGAAQLLGKAGKASRFDLAPLTNWPDHPDMSALELLSGRGPRTGDEVVIDADTAENRSLRLGSRVRIGTRRGIVSATVVGIAQRGGGSLGAAGAVLATTLDRTIELVGTDGQVDGISVRVASGATTSSAAAAIQTAVGPQADVLDAQVLLSDARSRIQDRLGTFTTLLLSFATVTLFVSSFLIWNTFTIVVAQRTRELGLLRAVGASSRQLFGTLVGEGVLVGAAASALGIGAGVLFALGLERLLSSFGANLPTSELVVAPRTVVMAVVVGMGVTLVSVIGPARRATRISPVAALSDGWVSVRREARWVQVIGVLCLAIGAVLGAIGLFVADQSATGSAIQSRLTWIAGGAGLLFAGLAALGRHLTRPMIGVLGWPWRRFGSVASVIAARNAVRNPRRTASTAAALMIGIALVSMTLVLGASVEQAYGGAMRSSLRADVVASATGIVPFGTDQVSAIRTTAGVTSAVALTVTRSQLRGVDERLSMTTTDRLSDLDQVIRPEFTRGGWPTDDQSVALSESLAQEYRVPVGGSVSIGDGTPQGRSLRVVGLYRRDEILDEAVVRPSLLASIPNLDSTTELVLVRTDGPTSSVVRRLSATLSTIPNSLVQNRDDYVADQIAGLDVVLSIVNVLLFFAVAVAALGIANTLALSVVERMRELGLLRAVGMSRRDLRRMVRVEGVLVAGFGGLLGLAVGVAFGVAVAVALPESSAQLTLPFGRLAAVAVVAGALGIVASLVPARRAGRVVVLDAIAAP